LAQGWIANQARVHFLQESVAQTGQQGEKHLTTLSNLKNPQSRLNLERLSLGILAIGALIRIIGYTSSAIWFDEAMTIYRAKLPFGELLTNRSEFSGNLLWELLVRPFVAINDSPAVVRLPALALGILSLWLAWMLIKKLNYGSNSMLFSCLFIALMPSQIWISQDARQYSLLTFLYLLGALCALNGQWLGLLASAVLVSYTHFVGPAYALGMLAVAVVAQPREWKRIALIGALAISSWLPWYLYRTQLLPLESFWLTRFHPLMFIRESSLVFWIGSLSGNWLVASFYISAICILLAALMTRGSHLPAFILFITPLSVMLARAFTSQNVIFYRTLIPLIIPLGLWLGHTIFYADRPAALPVMFVWLLLFGVSTARWDPSVRGGSVDVAADTIARSWQAGDILYYGTINTAMPFNYYLDGKTSYLMDGPVDINLNPPDVDMFKKASLESLRFARAWIIFPDDGFLLSRAQLTRLRNYASCGERIATLISPQIEKLQVYLVTADQLTSCLAADP